MFKTRGFRIRFRPLVFAAFVLLAAMPLSADENYIGFKHRLDKNSYAEVVEKTANMVYDDAAQNLAQKYGLNILNLTWEDTGRYKGSCVGPNISDMTIQVQQMDTKTEKYYLTCMPVIRYPNFSDKTADIDINKFYVLVGNEDGKSLRSVTLKELLSDLPNYLHNPKSLKSKNHSLLAKRDTHILLSAQACFLPIPQNNKAEFNPVIFNYQSYKNNPAVLTILATREGTSITVIDNVRDAFSAGQTWGQRLFFNQNGQRASLTGERLSDFNKNNGIGFKNSPRSEDKESGLNMVLLIQVPLKQKKPFMPSSASLNLYCAEAKYGGAAKSNVENAVVGHGKVEGPFTEIDNLAIERDANFPIRVTVQYYKATDNGVISEKDIKDIRAQIDKTYANADYAGSLVTEGLTLRPTEYTGDKDQPANWWEKFWKHYYERIYGEKK